MPPMVPDAPTGRSLGKQLIRVGAYAICPVVEEYNGIPIWVRLFRSYDQRAVESPIQLHADMRMVEIAALVVYGELVGERSARGYRGLCLVWDAIHIVADRDPMPVNSQRLREMVGNCRPNNVPNRRVDLGPALAH